MIARCCYWYRSTVIGPARSASRLGRGGRRFAPLSGKGSALRWPSWERQIFALTFVAIVQRASSIYFSALRVAMAAFAALFKVMRALKDNGWQRAVQDILDG